MIKEAFPGQVFPVGAVHEFICEDAEQKSASSGFISGIASFIMQNSGAAAWIGSSGTVFPHALKNFGLEPDKVFFVDAKNEKETLWVLEESLKCEGLVVVVADIRTLDFTQSRRLQLAVEQSGITCFLLRSKYISRGSE